MKALPQFSSLGSNNIAPTKLDYNTLVSLMTCGPILFEECRFCSKILLEYLLIASHSVDIFA